MKVQLSVRHILRTTHKSLVSFSLKLHDNRLSRVEKNYNAQFVVLYRETTQKSKISICHYSRTQNVNGAKNNKSACTTFPMPSNSVNTDLVTVSYLRTSLLNY